MTEVQQVYELVGVDEVTLHPRNPRRGDVEAIMASITANGWHGSITAQRSTRYVLAGNSRLRAARALGMTLVPVVWVDVDEATAERLLVADNRATDLGYFDEETLAELLVSADDLAGMLYSTSDLELLGISLPTEADLAGQVEGDEAGEGLDGDGEAREPAPALGGVEREGGVVLVRETPKDRAPEYVAAGVRSIVLPFALADYLAVTDGLRVVRAARGYATNAEAVAALVAEAAEASTA